jgi:hypothetical protein
MVFYYKSRLCAIVLLNHGFVWGCLILFNTLRGEMSVSPCISRSTNHFWWSLDMNVWASNGYDWHTTFRQLAKRCCTFRLLLFPNKKVLHYYPLVN